MTFFTTTSMQGLRPSLEGIKNYSGAQLTIDGLTLVLLIAAVLYSFCIALACRKLSILNRYRPELSTRKLLIICVTLVSVVRVMTCLGVAFMDVENLRAHFHLPPFSFISGGSRRDRHQVLDDAMTVIFDFPNCMVVSTYVLLTLVWAECFVKARLHTEGAARVKRTSLISFIIFNSLLYIVQFSLYAGLFLIPPTRMARNVIYVGISGSNFTAVLLVLVFYVYLNLRFSGFPYRSDRRKRSLHRVGRVMTLWSFTRVIWGVATMLVYVYKVELLQDSDTPTWSFLVLLVMFFVCEILPIVFLLDYSFLALVGLESAEIRWEDQDDMPQEAESISTAVSTEIDTTRAVTWHEDTLADPLLQEESSS